MGVCNLMHVKMGVPEMKMLKITARVVHSGIFQMGVRG